MIYEELYGAFKSFFKSSKKQSKLSVTQNIWNGTREVYSMPTPPKANARSTFKHINAIWSGKPNTNREA